MSDHAALATIQNARALREKTKELVATSQRLAIECEDLVKRMEELAELLGSNGRRPKNSPRHTISASSGVQSGRSTIR